MKSLIIISALLAGLHVAAQKQSDSAIADSLTEIGIAFHDDQKYPEAISVFEKALKIDKKNARANYEMANTLLATGRFKDCIKYADIVLKNFDQFQDQAYALKATAYDYLDEPQKAIKTYKEGIEKFPEDYMLPFNLAVTLLKTSEYKEAEIYAEKAVLLQKSHPGSNLMLGYANYYQDMKTETLLALYHFLLFENNSKRAKVPWSIIQQILKLDEKKEVESNINLTLNIDGRFPTVDLALTLTQALPDSISGLSIPAKFVSANNHFFAVLTPSEKVKSPSAYNDVYVPFFKDLHAAGHTEAFSYLICTPGEDPSVEAWIKTNSDKMDAFIEWANERIKK